MKYVYSATAMVLIAALLTGSIDAQDPDVGAALSADDLYVGMVLSQGEMVEGECVATQPVSLRLALAADAPFVLVITQTTQDCQEIIALLCTDATACREEEVGISNVLPPMGIDQVVKPRIEIPPRVADLLQDARDLLLDVNIDTKPGIDQVPLVAAASPNCDGVKKVNGRQWTQGYGGSWDLLTEIRSSLTFAYGCNDGSADLVERSGKCSWASWNGWRNNYCYRQYPATASDQVATGTKGEFECHNWNFCYSNHYVHSLQVNTNGRNSGSFGCEYNHEGTMPPYRFTSCNLA